ncbi:MAG: BON domain-containing protein [Acidimicrobiales bacterium]
MRKPDNLIESDIREELEWDPLLDSSRIEVRAKEGKVTLSGAVKTFFQRREAAEDAKRVHGVTALDNELLVGLVGAAIADVEVEAECKVALDADKFVPHGAVKAEVTDGWVTLHGQVRRHFQLLAAEHAVNRVDGVVGLTNKIEISADPIPSDVADRINKALGRNAIIDRSLITVSNVDHTIYLDGKASSWAAKQEAENTAWSAPGVNDVVDRLVIVP